MPIVSWALYKLFGSVKALYVGFKLAHVMSRSIVTKSVNNPYRYYSIIGLYACRPQWLYTIHCVVSIMNMVFCVMVWQKHSPKQRRAIELLLCWHFWVSSKIYQFSRNNNILMMNIVLFWLFLNHFILRYTRSFNFQILPTNITHHLSMQSLITNGTTNHEQRCE